VEDILHVHHGHCMKHYIGVLVEKSLIKISWNDKVTLHDLIEDMGKEIVRKESPKELGKRSRLWFHKDIIQVLQENKVHNYCFGLFLRADVSVIFYFTYIGVLIFVCMLVMWLICEFCIYRGPMKLKSYIWISLYLKK